jgi:hypothetical protein
MVEIGFAPQSEVRHASVNAKSNTPVGAIGRSWPGPSGTRNTAQLVAVEALLPSVVGSAGLPRIESHPSGDAVGSPAKDRISCVPPSGAPG